MKTKLRPGLLTLAVFLPICVGGISVMLTGDMMKEYFFLNKPPLAPPGWVFPVVWSILYVMMGLASYLVINSGSDRAIVVKALVFYGIQLVLNFFWSILFFNYGLYLMAFIWLLVLWCVSILCAVYFFKINRTAGWLFVPYIAWLTFAAYLNLGTVILNMGKEKLP